jgi:hypothetical protein
MLKQIAKFSVILSASTFLIATAHAAQLNLIADDIIQHQDNLNIQYVFTTAAEPNSVESGDAKGLRYQYIYNWLAGFNSRIANDQFIGNSQITFGYVKNGTEITPVSCQNIKLKDITHVVMTESGCSVS